MRRSGHFDPRRAVICYPLIVNGYLNGQKGRFFGKRFPALMSVEPDPECLAGGRPATETRHPMGVVRLTIND
jgi:hypothetical protein